MSALIESTLAAALLLAASPPDLVRPPPQLTGPGVAAVSVDASSRSIYGLRWMKPLVRMGAFRTVITSFGRPAVSDRHNLVIVGQGEGDVRALRVEDGRQMWRYFYGAPFETSILLVPPRDQTPELAIATARDGVVLALVSATGELKWKGNVGADSRAPIRLVEDTLLVTTVANKVHALSLADGTTRWTDGRPAPTALTVEGHSAATYHEGVVYAAFSDGYVEAFRFADGARAWSRPLSFGGEAGSEFVDADADPVVADGQLYVASHADGVFALDLAEGQTIWHRPAPAVTGLVAYDAPRPLLIAGSSDGYVWAFDRTDGTLVYRTRIPSGSASRLLVRDRLLVMTAGETGLLVLDARSGRPLQATAVPGSLASDPGVGGDYLAALSDAGHLFLFSLGDPGMVR